MNRDQLREALEVTLYRGPHPREYPSEAESSQMVENAVRLLLDGPLSDILELRRERVEEVWWCEVAAVEHTAPCPPDLRDDLVVAYKKAGLPQDHSVCGPRLLVKLDSADETQVSGEGD